jgi:diguanylate cyclase (GGDEF)-like protein
MRPAPVRGPREVRQVARAIDEAAAHIALAERQAHALAEGDLDHSALTESAPGHLGSSLQHAVRTLAQSMDEREEYRRRLAHEAAHDGLTALSNRNSSLGHLGQALERTRRNSASLAVMFVDLDGFKEINDTHGHLVGDAVLSEVAARLTASVREGDHVGRLGGDEFIIVAEPVAGVRESMAIASRVRDAISAPMQIGDLRIESDSSIGVAIAPHDSDLTPDEFLRDADLAVYKAKSLGTGCVELCDLALKKEALDGLELERALRQAILSNEFVLHYQPIVGRDQCEVLGMEALVRWDRPGHSLVAPTDFIPFAERSELIIDIDAWVIKQVAHRLSLWSTNDVMRDVPIAVNVSARHFAAERFVANILNPLRKHQVDPSRLIVEVTESALLSDLSLAAKKLQALRDAGITIALDDFGTGYTSLAYLRALPVDIIKIDRSFIADVEDESFVKLIIETGHLIGATITAEGVETEEQARRLLRLGCDRFQGYHFGKPRPIHFGSPLDRDPHWAPPLNGVVSDLAHAH